MNRLAARIRSGDRRALARGLSAVENRARGADDLLAALHAPEPTALRIGITGAPGASLGGWILSDAGPRYSHTFAAGTTIPASGTLVVASGRASGDIKPWGQRNVWNNDGDTATLAGPGGQIDALACS